MRKCSFWQKLYWLRRRDRHERRRTARKGRHWFAEHAEVRIPLPEVFSLSLHYDEVMDFVETLRREAVQLRRPVYVDFRPLREIGAAGAVLLAAEIDRWRRLGRFRPGVRDLSQWDPAISCLLSELGLFRIVNVQNPPHLPHLGQESLRFIRFRSGTTAEGGEARALRETIEELVGRLSDAERGPLYRAVTEAMNNVVQHAYPPDWSYETRPVSRRWWMAGAYIPGERRLMIAFFDQGVGIPATLPRLHPAEKLRRVISRLGLGDDDAARIQAAFVLGSSRTGLAHRGGGLLRDIRKLTEGAQDSVLRILSGRGEYIYDYHSAADVAKERRLTHHKPLGGTLIQWFVTVPNGRRT